MTTEDQIRDENLQYDINREVKLISMNILLLKRYCHLINRK